MEEKTGKTLKTEMEVETKDTNGQVKRLDAYFTVFAQKQEEKKEDEV